jgi:hypothetical protein
MKRWSMLFVSVLLLAGFSSVPDSFAADKKPVSSLPAGTVASIDNFEDGNFWAAVGDSWDKWGSHNLSLEAEVTDTWGTDGPNSADWVFDKIPAKGGQATFFCDQLALTDWTGVKYVVIDVKNPQTTTFTMSFSCQTTDGWLWTETAPVDVAPGVSTLVFDLTNGLRDGSHTPVAQIPGADKMKRAMFSVLTFGKDGGSGRFNVDNIRVIK